MMNTFAPSVTAVDLKKYAGKWYVVACIPTEFDKSRNYICEDYKLVKGGKVEIETSYFEDNSRVQSFSSAIAFPNKESNNVRWKVQYVWPFKSDYVVEELAADYSYAVVGHPQKKFLYIMNRTGRMSEDTFIELLTVCGKRGYDLTRLRKVAQ
jgi:apolipoprotein D and lipocalin family protein